MGDALPVAYVNGKRYELPHGRAEVTLLTYIRGDNLLLPAEKAHIDGCPVIYMRGVRESWWSFPLP